LDIPPTPNEGSRYGGVSGFAKRFFKNLRVGLKQAALPETVVAQSPGIGLQPAEDHVVVQLDIDRFGGLAQLPGLCEATDYGNWTTARLARRT
jgi:hypothetical protein